MRKVTGVDNVTEIRPGASRGAPMIDVDAGVDVVPEALASILYDYQNELLDAHGALQVLENYLAEIDDGHYSAMMHAVRGAARLVQRIAVNLDPAEIASETEKRRRRAKH